MKAKKQTADARLDIRISKEQKELLEKAVLLNRVAARNMTEFILWAIQLKANEIIEEHKRILASQADADIFFDALANPPKPNASLMAAAQEYKKLTGI